MKYESKYGEDLLASSELHRYGQCVEDLNPRTEMEWEVSQTAVQIPIAGWEKF